MPSRSMQKKEVVSAPLSRIGQRRQIVIPKATFEELRLQAGDLLEVTAKASPVHMEPKRIQDLDDVLNPKEATKVRQALKQVGEGQTKPWSQVKYELGL